MFSETLYGLEDMENMNLTLLNFNKDVFLNLTYHTNVPKDYEKYPTLKSWKFMSFDQYKMGIKCEFTNPL